ncbi:MAG: FAD-dependent oxidoreductase [Thermoanaerobaculia bacterium]|nr:FAD-dependent oxidoreductase [Thermoanaerobaculia bacterium]
MSRERSVRPAIAVLFLGTLLLSACASIAPPPVASAPPREIASGVEPQYDVIVVGAGLAGLTTARALVAEGHDVLVLEATNRIGGRAFTDTTSFSIPVDLGAAWIHGVEKNPLTALADWLGFHRVPTNLDGPVFIGNRQRRSEERLEAFGVEYEAMEEAMAEKTCAGEDLAVSQFLPESEFRALLAANIGPLEAGTEPEQTSSLDASSFESDVDDFVAEGIGTLVARLGEGLRVRLSSPVTAIRYGDGEVEVTAKSGDGVETIRARRAVVTVSTGVLAARRIAFQPDLPRSKWDAIEGLPMGLLNKVVFEFDGDILPEEGANEWVLYQDPAGEATPSGASVMAFVIKPLGANAVVGFYGANQAKYYEKAGDKAAIEYATTALQQMYGEQLVARIRTDRTKVTSWGRNPWTLGSYSSARPGMSKMHEVLAEPVGDVLFFAGEACGPPEFNGSLAAALVSGRKASRQVHESLAASLAHAP